MQNPELLIICLNGIIIFFAYFIVYPRFCGANGAKIFCNDLVATGLALLIAGMIFWDSGVEFSLFVFTLNWFWFAFLSYALIEIPLMIWYFKKHDIWSSFQR